MQNSNIPVRVASGDRTGLRFDPPAGGEVLQHVMIMNDERRVYALIAQYGLQPATRRSLSLFTLSCVAYGYTTLLRQQIGVSAEAVGGLGDSTGWQSMLNESSIARQTRLLIVKHGSKLEENVFVPVRAAFQSLQKKREEMTPLIAQNPALFLQEFIDVYPRYMALIGVYNCFWRCIGDGKQDVGLTEKQIRAISSERHMFATWYPELEQLFIEAITRLGEHGGFHGELLKYCTRAEVSSGAYTDAIQNAAPRQKGYFYLYAEDGGEEHLLSDHEAIANIRQTSYEVNTQEMHDIRGQSAFAGIISGTVVNMRTHPELQPADFPSDAILVTSMTHPGDMTLARNVKAIVTDEGGILCHAAIVARELSIPCIIGTKISTRVLKDGDRVEVDAVKGIVRKLD